MQHASIALPEGKSLVFRYAYSDTEGNFFCSVRSLLDKQGPLYSPSHTRAERLLEAWMARKNATKLLESVGHRWTAARLFTAEQGRDAPGGTYFPLAIFVTTVNALAILKYGPGVRPSPRALTGRNVAFTGTLPGNSGTRALADGASSAQDGCPTILTF